MSAPQNPVPTSAVSAGEAAEPRTSPSTNEPTTLTVNVPHGNPVACRDWTMPVGRVPQRRPDRGADHHQQRDHRSTFRVTVRPTQVASRAAASVPARYAPASATRPAAMSCWASTV